MIINWQPANLKTELISLIPLKENDFEQLYKAGYDPLIWEQHPVTERYTRPGFKKYFDESLSSGGSFVITDIKTRKYIGCTRLYNYSSSEKCINLGYTFLARAYWGGIYNRHSKHLLFNYAFQFVEVIYLHVGASNIRGQIATQKIGAAFVREIPANANNMNIAQIEFAFQKKDWHGLI